MCCKCRRATKLPNEEIVCRDTGQFGAWKLGSLKPDVLFLGKGDLPFHSRFLKPSLLMERRFRSQISGCGEHSSMCRRSRCCRCWRVADLLSSSCLLHGSPAASPGGFGRSTAASPKQLASDSGAGSHLPPVQGKLKSIPSLERFLVSILSFCSPRRQPNCFPRHHQIICASRRLNAGSNDAPI